MAKPITYPLEEDVELEGFWKDAEMVVNDEDENFQLVNPVVAAEWFLDNQSRLARLGYLNERLTEEIANLEVQLEWKKRDLALLERELIPLVYQRIAKSASSKIVDAHIPLVAREKGKEEALNSLSREIEELTREVERRKPAREKVQMRMKILSTIEANIANFLNWEKLEKRVNSQRNL